MRFSCNNIGFARYLISARKCNHNIIKAEKYFQKLRFTKLYVMFVKNIYA